MTTPSPEQQAVQPPQQELALYTSLDEFRDAYYAYREIPNRSLTQRPELSLSDLSEEDLARVDAYDVYDLSDVALLGTDPKVIEALPSDARDMFEDERYKRAVRLRNYQTASDVRTFLQNHPEVVKNFPEELKDTLSWRQRRALENLQKEQEQGPRRRGHLALVGAEVRAAEEDGSAVVDDDNVLPMLWDEEPEEERVNFANMTLKQMKQFESDGGTGYLDDTESKQFSARLKQLSDRAKTERKEARREKRQAKIPDAKENSDSGSENTEQTGFRKVWSDVIKTAREMRTFVDQNAGTKEGEPSPFASPEWQAHATARQEKIARDKAPKITMTSEKPRGEWVESSDVPVIGFSNPFDKILRRVEAKATAQNAPEGRNTPETGEALTPGLDYNEQTGELTVNGLQRLNELKKELLMKGGWFVWNRAAKPVLLGIGKVAEASYNMGQKLVTEPVPGAKPNERQRRMSRRRVGAILLGVGAAAATIGVATLMGGDSEHAQNVANSGANFGLPGVDSVEPYPETPTMFDTPGIDSVDPNFKTPTKAPDFDTPAPQPTTKVPEFDTPGIDTVDPQAPKTPEVPDAGNFDTPGIDTIPGTEAVGSGEALPQDSNIWDYSSNLLEKNGYKATDAEVAALKNWMLPQTGFTEQTANLMPAGFPMPGVSLDDLKNILGH